MGALKSITHSYSYGQYLFWYIERNDIPNIEKVLELRPDLLNSSLTASFKTTPLHRAAVNGNLQLVQLLIEKYQADVNGRTINGETPLIGAINKYKLQIVRYLLAVGANPNEVSGSGLKPVDYAILKGFYDIALIIYEKMDEKDLKDYIDYEILANKYQYRYVNYHILLDCLKKKIEEESVPDFLTKPKPLLEDPVVDPRESWKQWLLRNLQFKDPPLCERTELPEDLQPQNRRFGKLRHYLSTLAMTHMTQKPQFLPQKGLDIQSQNKDMMKEHEDVQSIQSI